MGTLSLTQKDNQINNHISSNHFSLKIKKDINFILMSTSKPPPLRYKTVMQEVFLYAIELFNGVMQNQGIELKNDLSLYKLRLVGKNFKPKTDMPGLSLVQKICDLKISEVAVQILNKEKAIISLNKIKEKTKQEQIEHATEQLEQISINEPNSSAEPN